jgi:hypothetical protein
MINNNEVYRLTVRVSNADVQEIGRLYSHKVAMAYLKAKEEIQLPENVNVIDRVDKGVKPDENGVQFYTTEYIVLDIKPVVKEVRKDEQTNGSVVIKKQIKKGKKNERND